ncbi:MAG: hypothetical protein Q8P41_10765 [Pseudomonadota bacterium]|nr:hypothetical protein [Pseudomonadota bacterium]
MRFGLVVIALLSLPACSGDSTDGTSDTDRPAKEGDDKVVTLTISAPQPGAEFDADEAVPLTVTAKRGAKATDIASATWTIGGWTGEGTSTEATGLPSGAHTVTVEAVVGEDTYSASVDITVLEPAQTFWSYAGTLEADVTLSTADYGDFDDHCSAPITFTVDTGTLVGGGQCNVFEDFVDDPLVFTLEGTVRGGNVTGFLIMATDGDPARTEFTGTGTVGNVLTASFDNTFRDSGNSVRIVGSWSATPQ